MTASFRVQVERDSVPAYQAFIPRADSQAETNTKKPGRSDSDKEEQVSTSRRDEDARGEHCTAGTSGYSSLIDKLAQEFNCCDATGPVA
jgi:hypothetical protein